MKKQLFLIIAMLIACVSGVQADDYFLKVAGVFVTSDNCDNITGEGISGKVTFDPETRTLTLENATIEAFNNDGIEMNIMYPNSNIGVGDDFTLVLKGQNKITVSQDNLTELHAMQTFCTTYIKGSGSLETNYDFEIDADCYISGGCSVKAEEILTSDYYGTGYTLSISGADTEVELLSDYSGVSGYDYFVLNDGLKIVKPKDGYYDDVNKYVVNANGERALWVKISANDEDDDWPYIVVAGHLVTRENASNVTGEGIGGKVSYDPETATLTLDNTIVSCSDDNSIIMSDDGGTIDHFTIKLIGDNLFSTPSDRRSDWQLFSNTIITGPGALNLKGAIYINGKNSLSIDGNCHIAASALVSWDFTDVPLIVSGAGTEIELSNNIFYFPSLTLNDGLAIVEPKGGHYVDKYRVVTTSGAVAEGVVIRAPKAYKLWVAGTTVNEENASDVMGDGTVIYDDGTKTLTLNGATITNDALESDRARKDGIGLWADIPGLKVVVSGRTNISSTHNTAVRFDSDATICGTGTLMETAPYCMFIAGAKLTVNGGVRLIANSTAYFGITGKLDPEPSSELVIEGANTEVRAYGPYGSIIRLKEFTLHDGLEIIEPAGAHFEGIHVYDADGNILVGQWVVISKPYPAYDLYVGGLRVNDHNCYDIDGTGKLKYDDATHTLTVGGDITATEGCAIESQLEELRVELKGNISISTTAEGAAAIKTDGDLILHGTGNNTLTLTGAANAIRMTKGSLGISFVTVTASGHRALEGNNDNTSCHLAIYGRDLTATSSEGEPAISGFRNGILLSGCEITEPAGGKIQNGAVVSADGQTASHVVISRLNNFPITVDNVAVSTSNCDDILGNGIFSYDADLQTLYVKGSYETAATNLIYSTLGDLTICTEAEAELKSGETVIVLKGNTALTGSARLSLVAPQKGIEMSSGGKLTLDGANIYVSGKYGLSGNVDRDVTLYIRNARVEIESTMRAVYEFHGGIELEDCEITLPEGGRVSNGEIVNSKGNTAKKVTIEPTGAATAIEHGAWNAEHASDGWYTLGGQRLDSQPTRPGIYLHGSHKIVVR